jgi:DNA topoisomerase-2
MADNNRMIPSLIDGLKPGQRKVIYTLYKKGLKGEIKVSSLSGAVIETAAYHNGNSSMEGAIIAMAQDFVGTNNLNLILSKGQFGSRLKGGEDSAASRYIFTKLNDLTHLIFRKEDNDILTYSNDDGYPIEPIFYVPIIPMILVNGASGIGSGYSTNIPSYNPIDIKPICKIN